MAVCLAIQCVVVGALLDALVFLEKKGLIRQTLIGMSFLLVALMLIMLAGNIIQITIWAGLFFGYGEFKEFATAFYHSVVNFATLGYGDIVMSEKRRLLGALEAANGVLMFALTTGFLYTSTGSTPKAASSPVSWALNLLPALRIFSPFLKSSSG